MEAVCYFKLIISDYHFWIIMRYCNGVLLVQSLHSKDESAFKLPFIFDYLFSTQWLQVWQKIELLPATLLQILDGHFTGSDLADKSCLVHISFVLLTLTWSPFFTSSNAFAINTRSSV